jgi:anti-anti-sigma factor
VEIQCQSRSSITVVSPRGRIDTETSPELEYRLQALIQRGDAQIVLDLAGVSYMSSRGLRVLLLVSRKCQQSEARFVLAGLNDFTNELLTMTGFLPHFEVFGKVDDAVMAMTSQ